MAGGRRDRSATPAGQVGVALHDITGGVVAAGDGAKADAVAVYAGGGADAGHLLVGAGGARWSDNDLGDVRCGAGIVVDSGVASGNLGAVGAGGVGRAAAGHLDPCGVVGGERGSRRSGEVVHATAAARRAVAEGHVDGVGRRIHGALRVAGGSGNRLDGLRCADGDRTRVRGRGGGGRDAVGGVVDGGAGSGVGDGHGLR